MSEQDKAVPAPDLPLPADEPAGGLGGENTRGEAAGCPTGLADADQASVTQAPGGAGAPNTGASPAVPYAPGEGVTEEQVQRSGLGAAKK